MSHINEACHSLFIYLSSLSLFFEPCSIPLFTFPLFTHSVLLNCHLVFVWTYSSLSTILFDSITSGHSAFVQRQRWRAHLGSAHARRVGLCWRREHRTVAVLRVDTRHDSHSYMIWLIHMWHAWCDSIICDVENGDSSALRIWMSRVARMNETWHTCEKVVAHVNRYLFGSWWHAGADGWVVWRNRETNVKKSWGIWMEWVNRCGWMSHTKMSWHTCEIVMSHIWTSHVTLVKGHVTSEWSEWIGADGRAVTRIWISHDTRVKEPWHMYAGVMALKCHVCTKSRHGRIYDSCIHAPWLLHTCDANSWTGRVAPVNGSWHTYKRVMAHIQMSRGTRMKKAHRCKRRGITRKCDMTCSHMCHDSLMCAECRSNIYTLSPVT